MSLYAFAPIVPRVPMGFERYGDLPRRLVRLAHIAAIMLPILNIILAPHIDRLRVSEIARRRVSSTLLFGATFGPATLLVEAFSETAADLHPSGLPFVAFTVAVGYLALHLPRQQSRGGGDVAGGQPPREPVAPRRIGMIDLPPFTSVADLTNLREVFASVDDGESVGGRYGARRAIPAGGAHAERP
jgi:hypothetical protein